MPKKTYLPVFRLILSLVFCFHAELSYAKSFTLSDEQLANLDCGDEKVFHSQTLATVTAKRDKPGPGVEFDLYFPPGCNPKTNPVYFGSSVLRGAGKVAGFDTSDFEAFNLKFGLVSVNDSNSVTDFGPMMVGSLVNSNTQPYIFRPYSIGIGRGMSRSVTAGTAIIEKINVKTIGFAVSLHQVKTANIDANNSQGLKITLLIAPDPASEIIYINPDSAKPPEFKAGNTIVVPDNHPTIQAAIDAAESNTLILIKPGIYREGLTLKNGVGIKGQDANTVVILRDVREGTVIQAKDCDVFNISDLTVKHTGLNDLPSDFTGRFPLIDFKSSKAVISNCNIMNSGSDGIAITGGNVLIRECNIINSKLNGIITHTNSKVDLEKNNCSENAGNGIYFAGCFSGRASGNICRQNNYHGISCEKVEAAFNLSGNICENNKINGIYFGAGAKGIANNNTCAANVNNGITVTGVGTNINLEENVANNNIGNGIYFGEKADGLATGNKCNENKLHGISIADFHSSTKIDKNQCINNKFSGLRLGQGYNAQIGDNDIRDNGEISYGEVVHLLSKNKFSELDSIAAGIRAEKRRYNNGNWQLDYFYKALSEDGIGRRDFQKIQSQFEDWIKQQPNSITPRIALARAYKTQVWKERGSGYAIEVSEGGRKAFEEYLQKAERILIEAEDLNASDPDLYYIWLEVGRGLGKTDEETDSIFERGITLEKDYWPLYTARGFTLSPRWGGNKGQFEAFARRAVELTDQQEGKILYFKVADTLIGRNDCEPLQFKQLGFSYKMLQQALADFESRYPDAKGNYLLNISCYLACAYNDREKALNLFAQIGDKWDKSVWQNEEILNKYKDWALGKTKSVPEPNSPAI